MLGKRSYHFYCTGRSDCAKLNPVKSGAGLRRHYFPASGPRVIFFFFSASVNSSMFKGLKQAKLHFWQCVLETWLDNNRVNSTSPGCTLVWNNRNVMYQEQVGFFLLLLFFCFFSKNGLKQEL